MRLTPSRVLRAASYAATVHLPKSSLPFRPPLKQPSPYTSAVIDEVYKWNASRPDDQTRGTFVLHDGPPYANGPLHVGHALNKILKDIVNRFQLSQGKKVLYTPGWDCHGLPIEIKALQSRQGKDVSAVEVRKVARSLAEKTVKQQMEGFKAWGIMGDWENAYKTMDKSFELRQLAVFQRMVEKGLIYRQHKPVHWSPSSRTALAESELEYVDDHKSTAAYVAYPLVDRPPRFQKSNLFDNAYVVIWTTTPWTLPANRAIAINEDLFYCCVEIENSAGLPQKLILEESRLKEFVAKTNKKIINTVVSSFVGSQLLGTSYANPLQHGSAQPILPADFVTSDSGTGLVHMAPGHGMEDYEVCTKHGISAFVPVDDEGRFTREAYLADPSLLVNKHVQSDGIEAVLTLVKDLGKQHSIDFLLGTHELRHRYPVDWRTLKPVITRATEQWFADAGSIKAAALEAIQNVRFIPERGRSRLESFTKSRSQWCISRQRAWGVPIPALFRIDDGSNAAVMTADTIQHIMDVARERGIDAWWTDAEDDLRWIPPYLEGSYVRGKDTMDVWFDSGTTWTMLEKRTDGAPVADIYLEGSDQHRGWFQSSLLTHVADQTSSERTDYAAKNVAQAPFGTLITHGFTLDSKGKKMSKSLGNVISPHQIMDGSLLKPIPKKSRKQLASTKPEVYYDGMGPDALRLWAASSDYTTDVVVGGEVLETVNKSLQKYRNTFKWLLGALADYKLPVANQASPAWQLADRIALHQLSQASASIHEAYQSHQFYKAVKLFNAYLHINLSTFYFEILKDRLYTGLPDERQPAQDVAYLILEELLAMLAPITPFMVEEVWQHMPSNLKSPGKLSPLKNEWKPYAPSWRLDPATKGMSDELEKVITEIDTIHVAVKAAAEEARRAGKMGSSLDCDVQIHIPRSSAVEIPSWSVLDTTLKREQELASIFVVSGVSISDMSDETRKMLNGKPIEDTSGDWMFPTKLHLPWSGELEGLVTVRKPARKKCARCWRHAVHEARNKELCKRCTTAVDLHESAETSRD